MSVINQVDMELDSLLDEVESKYIFSPPSNSPVPFRHNFLRDEVDIEVETLLEDIKKIERIPASGLIRSVSISQQAKQLGLNIRCEHLYLAGTYKEMGKSSNACMRACDNIRCTSCDFVILAIDNRKWTELADYLFFRNHMPDRQKLLTQTRVLMGCRAYACQCTWVSVKELLKVADNQSLKSKWVCGKHL